MTCNVWRVHAWGDPALEDATLREHVVAVGGHELGNLSHRPDLPEAREQLRERFPDRRDRGIANFVGYCRQFLYDMQPGDLVALSLSNGRVAIGCVTGGFRYGPSAPDRIGHARAVEWLVSDLPRVRFGHDINATFESRGTVCRIRAQGPERRLRTAADTGNEARA